MKRTNNESIRTYYAEQFRLGLWDFGNLPWRKISLRKWACMQYSMCIVDSVPYLTPLNRATRSLPAALAAVRRAASVPIVPCRAASVRVSTNLTATTTPALLSISPRAVHDEVHVDIFVTFANRTMK